MATTVSQSVTACELKFTVNCGEVSVTLFRFKDFPDSTRTAWIDRNQGRLRCRRLRCMHGIAGRGAGMFLSGCCWPG